MKNDSRSKKIRGIVVSGTRQQEEPDPIEVIELEAEERSGLER